MSKFILVFGAMLAKAGANTDHRLVFIAIAYCTILFITLKVFQRNKD